MPPASKKGAKTKQSSIKDMLLAKSAANAANDANLQDEIEKITLPYFFSHFTDVRAPVSVDGSSYDAKYSCLKMARVYFRQHSNIDELLRAYLGTIVVQDKPLSAYTSAVIRAVTSSSVRKHQAPFNRFKFNTPRDEAIARTLLINRRIQNEEDLENFFKFQEHLELKLSTVATSIDNPVHDDAMAYIRRVKPDPNTGFATYSKRYLKHHVERSYYERSGLLRIVFLGDLDVNGLEDISNFKRVVEKMMLSDNLPESGYSIYASAVLANFKQDVSLLESVSNFIVDPMYDLISNNMTAEQQSEAASSFYKFYTLTNARNVRRSMQVRVSKQQFYEDYRNRSQQDRKIPPYNSLYYQALEDEQSTSAACNLQFESTHRFAKNPDREKSFSAATEANYQTEDIQSSQSSSQTMFEAVHHSSNLAGNDLLESSEPAGKSTPTATVTTPTATVTTPTATESVPTATVTTPTATESTPTASDTTRVDSEVYFGSESSRLTVLEANLEIKRKSESLLKSSEDQDEDEAIVQFSIPSRFLKVQTTISDDLLPIMKVLCAEKKFVVHVKNELRALYKKDFEKNWKESKPLILHCYVKEHWETSPHLLIPIANKCSPTASKEALKLIEAQIELQSHSSSAVSVEELTDDDDDDDDDDDIEIITPDDIVVKPVNIPVANVSPTIKKEPDSEPPQQYTENSDVVWLGPIVDEQIEITDTEDVDDSLIALIRAEDENPSSTVFLEILRGTQSQDLPPADTSLPNHSDETLKHLRKYEAESVRLLRSERAQKESELQKALKETTNQQGPSKRKNSDRPGPKSKRYAACLPNNNVEYVDDEDSPPFAGNNSPERLQQALNDEFSVFLSSQLIQAESEFVAAAVITSVANPFTFASAASSSTSQGGTNGPSNTFCFTANLHRVVFEKNIKFELHVNLPQFTLYNIVITNQSIPSMLNINSDEYNSLLNLLSLVEKYEFVTGEKPRSSVGGSGNVFIVLQLDMFFTNQVKFKSFNLCVDGDEFTCVDGNHTSSLTADLTTAIHPELLSSIKKLRK